MTTDKGARHHQSAPPHHPHHTPNNAHFVRLVSHGLDRPLKLLLGDGTIVPEAGYGGWSEVTKPDDVSITEWDGHENFKLSLPVIVTEMDISRPFSKRAEFRSAANVVHRLTGLARSHDGREPRLVRVYGKAMPPGHNGDKYVISGIEWGLSEQTGHGKLIWQALTLSLLRYTKGDDVEFKRKKHRNRGDQRPHQYHIRKGDTLMSIAKEFYGDWHKWKLIADKNHIHHPRKLRVGRLIILPNP